ncbi:MAG: tetratricopeptide repeat protein [Crocinitomicaceae bacterium]|jgi:tetratricopeptide (TPR) repeat protein|nr:tetratricopeptide repeat protein [Crocinitomicaceae bacterium]
MMRVGIFIVFLLHFAVFAQQSERYAGEYTRYHTAEDLYEKQKYSAAQQEFDAFMEEICDAQDPFFIKAKYYHALCALYLFHSNAESLLLGFLAEYPESIYRMEIYFELGKHYYRKKDYKRAVSWLTQIDIYNLKDEQKGEYYFKLGYAYFQLNQLKEARNAFYEIINADTEYWGPALYYYSHIAYTEKSYQTALEGFLKLEKNPSFAESVPYYIAQIYYLQGKFEELIAYAPSIMDSVDTKNSIGIEQLVGDAFYQMGKYDEAVPYLESYNRKSATTRDEDYQLGYAYFMSKDYVNAIKMFDKVAKVKDELGQVSLYHIGESYLKLDNLYYARNAFELASNMPFDATVEEDALYNYAILCYKLDYNPFNDAVEAFNLYLNQYPKSNRNQDIYQYLINIYTTMKNYPAALASMDKIENKDFKIKTAYQLMAYNYAVELFQGNQLDQAIEYFKMVKKYPIDPKLNALSMYWIGESYYRKQEFGNAITWYRKFLEEPGGFGLQQHNDAYYNIGYCYYSQQDYANAITSFRTFTQDVTEDSKARLTDAYLRIGDCYYVQKPADDNNAILFYQKAIEVGAGQADYAKFQTGLSLGYLKRYPEKISMMLDIINNHRGSVFIVPAIYEVAETYRITEDNSNAKRYYNQLLLDYPTHARAVDAIFQLGSIAFTSEEYAQAETHFLRIVNEHPNSSRYQESLESLRRVYTAMGKPEKYETLLNSLGVQLSQSEQDELLFDPALLAYEKGNYPEAITLFESYFTKVSNPSKDLEALYCLGTSYLKTGKRESCILNYKKILAKPTNMYTETAALEVSKYEYELKNYDAAIDAYKKLELSATYPQHALTAKIGLMRCYTFRKELDFAKPYAQQVLKDSLALENVRIEANYVIGKSEFELGNYDAALDYLFFVMFKSNAAIGAECHYMVAYIYHAQQDYSGSETEVRDLVKNRSSYSYWVAKALILQAKNSMAIEDYVQAEYTINSVLNNYKVTDDGILTEAQQVKDQLMSLKTQEKSIEINNGGTIEIGGDNE